MSFNRTYSNIEQVLRQELLSTIDEVLNSYQTSLFASADPQVTSNSASPYLPSFTPPTRFLSEQFPSATSFSIQSLQQHGRCNSLPALPPQTFCDYARSGMTYPGYSRGGSSFLGRHSVQEYLLLPHLQNDFALPLSNPMSGTTNLQLKNVQESYQRDQRCLLQSLNLATPDPVSLVAQLTSGSAHQQRQEDAINATKMTKQQVLNHQDQSVTKTLIAIGSRPRKRSDPYIDVLSFDLPPAPQTSQENSNGTAPLTKRRFFTTGGLNEPFPDKLHHMLRDSHEHGASGFSDIVSFFPHGRAFAVHDVERFVTEIMPRYFPQQTKWSSFTRQLNLWGFLKIRSGPDALSASGKTSPTPAGGGFGFYHELFLQSRPDLCLYVRRVGASTGLEDRRKLRKFSNISATKLDDPDFYTMRSATR